MIKFSKSLVPHKIQSLIPRNFSSKKLPNLKKYGDFKFNFKSFLNDFSLHVSNSKNRKSDSNPELVKQLYSDYTSKANDLNLMRKKLNDLRGIAEISYKSGNQEKLRNTLNKDSKKYQDDIKAIEKEMSSIETKLMSEVVRIPNLTHTDSPVGDESKARIVKIKGNKTEFDFNPLDHLKIGEKYDLFDFNTATKITGAKFVFLKNQAAILELALINWTVQNVIKRGYTFMITPDLCKNALIEGCGFVPRDKSASQIYNIEDDDLGLIATSEITCAGIFANEILNKKDLPKKFVSLSHCYRKEAGQGQHSKGLYRLHQFTKVEMFAATEGDFEKSQEIHNEMLEIQEELYTQLGFHFRILDMPTEELGSSAYRKYDIEAWMPSKGDFGEICSTSNCTDYQSARLNCLYFNSGLEKRLIHTVNGTACAIPRVILTILENFQTKEGKVYIPEILHPYTFGLKVIE